VLEFSQIFYIIITIILTALITVLGIKLYFVLRESLKAVIKLNYLLDNLTSLSKNIQDKGMKIKNLKNLVSSEFRTFSKYFIKGDKND
jgi:hypothetical protein